MLSLIGMGPGHIDYVTPEAAAAIRRADIVLAFDRVAETAEQIRTPILRIRRLDDIFAHLAPEREIALLVSGDPGFFSMLEYLHAQHIEITRVIPGISSLQYFMAALRKSWHGVACLSLHGRDDDLTALERVRIAAILTDKTNTPHLISKRLHQLGWRGRLHVGSHLSYPNERILAARIGDDIDDDGSLSIVVVERDEMAS